FPSADSGRRIAVAPSSACASEGGIAPALSTGATSASRVRTSVTSGLPSRAARAARASPCLPKASRAARLPDVYLSHVSFCCAAISRISRSCAPSASSSSRPPRAQRFDRRDRGVHLPQRLGGVAAFQQAQQPLLVLRALVRERLGEHGIVERGGGLRRGQLDREIRVEEIALRRVARAARAVDVEVR